MPPPSPGLVIGGGMDATHAGQALNGKHAPYRKDAAPQPVPTPFATLAASRGPIRNSKGVNLPDDVTTEMFQRANKSRGQEDWVYLLKTKHRNSLMGMMNLTKAEALVIKAEARRKKQRISQSHYKARARARNQLERSGSKSRKVERDDSALPKKSKK